MRVAYSPWSLYILGGADFSLPLAFLHSLTHD
jgi:hypothetical protein